jgi:hypothetical protein
VVKKLSGDKLKILSHSNPESDMSKAYSSNLSEWQWELIEPLSCRAFYGGKPAVGVASPIGETRAADSSS